MKIILIDILFGVLIVIVITLLEFIVTIPFGLPADDIDRDAWAAIISRELLITAVPAFFTTFAFAFLLKTTTKKDAIRRAIIWTSVIFLNYFIMGLGNDNIGLIFGTIGVYVLLACVFAGPLVYSKVKRLK